MARFHSWDFSLWSVYCLTPSLHLRVTYAPHALRASDFKCTKKMSLLSYKNANICCYCLNRQNLPHSSQCHTGAGTAITSAYCTSPTPVFHKIFCSESCHLSLPTFHSLHEFVMEMGSRLKVVPFKALYGCYGNVKTTPQHLSASLSPSCL